MNLQGQPENPGKGRRLGIKLPCAVAIVFLILYALTAQRGVSWQDSGIFQYGALSGAMTLPENSFGGGLAVLHPTYRIGTQLFSRCFPETLRVYSVNLFSGIGMAAALGLLAYLVQRLTGNARAAVGAVVTLGLAQMAWWLATVAEVYTWSLAFLFAELLCLVNVCEDRRPRWWMLLALINGMHLSVHNMALLNLPVYGILFLWSCRSQRLPFGRLVAACAGMWLLGAAVLAWYFVKDVAETHSVAASLRSLLVGQNFSGQVLGTGKVKWQLAAMNWTLAAASFLSPCWLFAAAALRRPTASPFRLCLLTLTGIHFLFWVRYFVPDQATFIIPTLGLSAVWAGIGIANCGPWLTSRKWLLAVAAGMICQAGMPPVLGTLARPYATRVRELPFRDEAQYWLVPWKHNEDSAQRFVDTLNKTLRKGDVLVADLTAANPVVADAVLHPSPFRLLSGWTEEGGDETMRVISQALADGHRAFAVSPKLGYTPRAIVEKYQFEQEGILWRIKERQ